ncbi:uncharacterized protein LOC120702588 [Panicum virgatum]|uniref:Uncharacterized protein n=1 Tax=Panicum virgatum TaxID=38727 RepID=A0A8T0XEZ0_PANVG|nr:uncharacterized protein LOC120702588 [Panicum virgatum]XP_039842393.1 uncharacterized protein LOC120702588 [Panicum virgatum]KAG2658620.1 hypothetical protein PVAP13_1KG290610 [Panicum virgatum]KAG2658621.1 hypothetical protein PVAP13_1KG290610 [Panicum virgatum]
MRRSLLGSRVYQEAEAMEAKMLLKLQELEVKLQESQEANHAAYWSGFEMFDFKEKCAYIIGHTFVFHLDTYNRPLEIMTTTSSSMFSPRNTWSIQGRRMKAPTTQNLSHEFSSEASAKHLVFKVIAMVYQLLSMAGNVGNIPTRLVD